MIPNTTPSSGSTEVAVKSFMRNGRLVRGYKRRGRGARRSSEGSRGGHGSRPGGADSDRR